MAAAKSAQEGLCELLDDSIGSDGFDPREAPTKSKQASSAKSPLVVKRKPTSNSNANARQPQHKDAKTMLPKPLETPGSDDDDDNDQLSGLDDSVDEALVLCLSVQATFACTRWSFVVSGCLLSTSQRAVTVVTRTLFPSILLFFLPARLLSLYMRSGRCCP